MKAYLARYRGDVSAFIRAYLVATLAILPITLIGYGAFFWFVYAFLWFFGLLDILIFAIATALLGSYGYKFLVFGAAVAANVYYFSPLLFRDPLSLGANNDYALIFWQVVFLFPLIYGFLERPWSRASTHKFE